MEIDLQTMPIGEPREFDPVAFGAALRECRGTLTPEAVAHELETTLHVLKAAEDQGRFTTAFFGRACRGMGTSADYWLGRTEAGCRRV